MIFGELLILPSGFWHKGAFSISYRSLNFCSSESLEIQNGLQEVKRFGGGGCFGLEVNLACKVGENLETLPLKASKVSKASQWYFGAKIQIFHFKSQANLTNFTYLTKLTNLTNH